jgi:hypothetical protein
MIWQESDMATNDITLTPTNDGLKDHNGIVWTPARVEQAAEVLKRARAAYLKATGCEMRAETVSDLFLTLMKSL